MIHILLCALLLRPAIAGAACNNVVRAIQRKVARFKEYQKNQEATLAALTLATQECERAGASLSRKSAEEAAALTCAAQADAQKVNTQMKELGGQCQKRFRRIQNIQGKLFDRFARSKADIDVAVGYAAQDPLLQKTCGEEIKAAKKLQDKFGKLGEQIAGADDRSALSVRDYGKFHAKAKDLGRITAIAAKDCDSTNTAVSQVSAPKGDSAPPGARKLSSKPSPNSPSDITGTRPPTDR